MTASLLCQDLAWLTAEVLFRNKDVGFQGSLAQIAHHSLSLLAPHLIIAAAPSRSVSVSQWKKNTNKLCTAKLYCLWSLISLLEKSLLIFSIWLMFPFFQERPFYCGPSLSCCLTAPFPSCPDCHTHFYFGGCRWWVTSHACVLCSWQNYF